MMARLPLLRRAGLASVAVFRALHLGDMLCAVPALRALRRALPDSHITLIGLPWASQFAQRFRMYVDAFAAFPGHPLLPEQAVQPGALTAFYAGQCAARTALALQLHGSGEVSNNIVAGFGAHTMAGFTLGPPVHRPHTLLFSYPQTGTEPERLLSLITQLGGEPDSPQLEFPLTRADTDELQASGVAAGLTPGRYLCIHPGARTRAKCWPPSHFAMIADQLATEFALDVVLTGSAAETALTAQVAAHMRSPARQAAGPLSIGAMAALMRDARLLVCNDTGVSHIAAGLRLPSVVVFSKADIARWAPLNRHRHRCIWDPDAQRAGVVLQHARMLLSGTEPGGARAAGLWPYW